MQNIEYERERLKGVEKEAQEESEGQEEEYQQVDDEQYDTVPKTRWCTKERALVVNARMIMKNLTPH